MSFLHRLSLSIIAFLFISVAAVNAADCPDIVKTALNATDSACSAVGRNQACYGNISLTAEPQAGIVAFNFTKPGDLADIVGMKQLVLSPLDAKADTWGVALMKVQANLPDTLPGQNVSFVLFGDVQIDNAVGAAATLDVSAKQSANLREQPSKTGKVVFALKSGMALVADGISDDGAWLRVHSADSTVQGWVSTTVLTVTGDLKTLAVVKSDAPRYSPMQAFYFKSGLNDAPCSQAPDSGILIQTPQGAGKISLNVDGADITLGSTAYFQAQASGEMTLSVVEGQGTVTAGGKTVIVPAGSRARVPLDANLTANGTPVGPEPYDAASLGALPLKLVPQTIAIAPAYDPNAAIIPTPGKWLFSVNSVTAGKGCPSGMEQFITAAMFPKNTLTIPDGPFDLKQIFDSSGSRMPASAVVTHPQPNEYDADFSDSGSKVHFVLNITSPGAIGGTLSVEGQGCQLNLDVSMTLSA
ncbi:MAG: SH3 domain-containing protein [Anaerolineae bacterium]|nr:SH3 domain-containing protein [Anaerolineae bacterium]